MELLQNHIILLALTFGIFYAARQLQKWTGWIVLNPILVTIVVLMLYQHLGQIRRQFLPIFLSQLAGCIVGLVSVVGIAQLTGASRETIISLAPKSVTTPIAMEVCQAMGGIPSLTAAIVVTVGLFGAVFGFKVLEVWHIKNPYSQGLSIGTASHAVGTSRAMEKGETYGTYASLGLILNGLLTALLAPFVLQIMHIL